MKIKWELKGAKELRKIFDNKRALRMLVDPMNKSVSLVWKDSVKDAPHKTGHMRRNIYGKPAKVEGAKITGIIGSKVHYTIYQELGTKAHTAKKAKFLVFSSYGRIIRRKKVKGIKPKYFMTNALKNNINKIVALFQRTIDKIFR